MKRSTLAVLIPAWNEEATVADVVGAVREECPYDVIVIDDASTDRTAERAAAAGATVLNLSVNLGAWGATQTGIRFALKQGYTRVITIDADGQHLPSAIPSLLAPIACGEANSVVGSCIQRGSTARKWAWRFFRRLTGLKIEDLTSGFRAYDLPAMRMLASKKATLLEHQDIGVLLLMIHAGLSIKEIQVPMRLRVSGSSKVFSSWFRVAKYLMLTLTLCASHTIILKERPHLYASRGEETS
ncbi:MAG: glycosyltransferase family 2 protein [Syntrophaceae bacterium]|nr:glycosyltransferase family 2 protein [Syntrophaceae bacterium]